MEKKKYETPEVNVMSVETAPLLAGSDISAGGEAGNIKGLSDYDEEGY